MITNKLKIKNILIYFGGYGSMESISEKYKLFKNNFNETFDEILFFGSIFSEFENYKEKLEKLNETSNLYFIGSSLGSIMSIYFANLFNSRLILINPSYFPEYTLRDLLLKEDYEIIDHIKNDKINNSRFIVILKSLDEIVPAFLYDKFKNIFKDNIKFEDLDNFGDHSYIENLTKIKLNNIKYYMFSREELGEW